MTCVVNVVQILLLLFENSPPATQTKRHIECVVLWRTTAANLNPE
jgi:hypothetical protein